MERTALWWGFKGVGRRREGEKTGRGELWGRGECLGGPRTEEGGVTCGSRV